MAIHIVIQLIKIIPSDMRLLLDLQRSDRSRAIILLTFETWARAGEVLHMAYDDFYQKPNSRHYVKIRVSKTKAREIPVEECVQLVQSWKNSRPHANDESPSSYPIAEIP